MVNVKYMRSLLLLLVVYCCLAVNAQEKKQGVTLDGTVQSDLLLAQNGNELGAVKAAETLTNN